MAKTETCLAVVAALGERMRATSIERVKVVDLCRDVGIARATFYEYFQDVFAVATWMWDYLMKTTLYQMGSTLDCYTAHLRKFEVLREHREFFENAMRIVGYPSICQHGGRMMYEVIEDAFMRKANRPLTSNEALYLEFFNTGAKHMTRHWVERGMVEEPPEMARLFTDNVPGFILPYLEPEPGAEPNPPLAERSAPAPAAVRPAPVRTRGLASGPI